MKKQIKNLIFIFFVALFLSVPVYASQAIELQLSKIENSIWGFEYSKDDISRRLSRIENNVLGTVNLKLTQEQRIKKINEAMGFESYEDSLKQAYEIDKTEVAGVNYPQIDSLEYQMFSSTYENENIYKRLDRLEKKIFGVIQDGDLATRTEKLKAFIKKDVVAQDTSTYYQPSYAPNDNIQQYMGSQNKYDSSDIYIQLAGLETILFGKTYSQDPVGLRLNRLERRIFQRDFNSDDEYLRLQRLQAAANAQQTAKLYEANKIQKYTSTGMQIGSILLMILALIL